MNSKELQKKIAKEFKLDKLIKQAKWEKEFDKWFNKLIKKNGTTKYDKYNSNMVVCWFNKISCSITKNENGNKILKYEENSINNSICITSFVL